ncbi:MAG: sulfite exporter TauE/SafE family protein [Gemmobacter sp.]
MPDPALLAAMTAILFVIGAFAGVIAGLLGVGGGIVLVPAFFYAFGALGYGGPQLMQVCLATSLATIVVTSARSARAHNARGAVDWAILRGWSPGIVIGALVGVGTAALLRSEVLQAIFGILALVIGLWLGFGRASWRIAPAMPAGAVRAILSPAVGFLSVLMGIGGGSFGVPLMTLYGVPIHRAVGTASLFGMAIAVPSILGFLVVRVEGAPPLTLGAINLPAFAVVVLATFITTPFGARLAHKTDAARLKRIFAVFLTLVAFNMLRKAAGW